VLLHRSHDPQQVPRLGLGFDGEWMQLRVPADWYAAHPLTQADLATEIEYLRDQELSLAVSKD
jgi:exopolyphosphatase/guanosine-5'-triphosphate,3'-diphosphate pyrophosphatase